MATLSIASKANHATTLPALLVASYLNEADPNVKLNIKIEDVAKLSSGASVELESATDATVSGSQAVIAQLTKEYKFLQSKSQDLVRLVFFSWPSFETFNV